MSHSLLESFKGDIITPNSPSYKQSISRWAANASRPASYVFFVKDADDISIAIKFACSQSPPLEIAIRGGGHSASGASSTDGGAVIDLSRYLDTCMVGELEGYESEGKVAFVGGGAIWKTVDEECAKYGLATVGGTINHVRLL
jgi:FAD/FMN-containing dehydrogenase